MPRFALLTVLLLLLACAPPPAVTKRPPEPPPPAGAGAQHPPASQVSAATPARSNERGVREADEAVAMPTDASARLARDPSDGTPIDPTVWKVPLAGSPARGPSDALVTIVMFGEMSCPVCATVMPTLSQIESKQAGKVRLVFKHDPIPSHARSQPAAELAAEARAQNGDRGFFEALELLLSLQDRLEDSDLAGHARALGLDADRAKRALASRAHRAAIEADQELAAELKVSGALPELFVNGRRLKGAQTVETIERLVDEEMAKASALVAAGTRAADVYGALQKDAKTPVTERIVVAAPPADSPAKGALRAPVTIQMFAGFQCPFCKRAQPTIDELVAAYPGKVRVVWRHMPMPFHKQGALAAEAAQEAFRQKGSAGFWKMAALLFEDQSATSGLEREALKDKARKIGLNVPAFEAALDTGRHRPKLEADAKAAADAGVSGTPGFAINDYFLGGAFPLPAFKRLVKKALGPYEAPAPGSVRKPVAKSSPVPGNASPSPSPSPAAEPRETFGAKHLLVMYQGSRRAPPHVTRTKQEARARAEEALAKARRGVPFARLVEDYSDEPNAASRGGDLGVFPRGAMVPEFQDAVEKLRVGALSGLVESPFGFHLVLRTK